METEPLDYQDVIDQALQLVYSHHHRLISQLYPAAFQSLTMEQLRTGPLGRDLGRLAGLARGQARESKEHVLQAIDSVVQLLFWPAAADDYIVPRSFWDTELGRMMALAKYRAFEPSELVERRAIRPARAGVEPNDGPTSTRHQCLANRADS